MTNYYFTSDTHFGHENILKKFCPETRLGATIQEHDEILIRNWNNIVGPEDHVWNLGDVFFSEYDRAKSVLSRLNGKKYLIWGNHDKVLQRNKDLWEFFEDIYDYKELVIERTHVILFHYPIQEWNRMHHGSFHFHGHTHGTVTLPGRGLDVGIDGPVAGRRMTPISWAECKRYCEKRPIMTHHGDKKNL